MQQEKKNFIINTYCNTCMANGSCKLPRYSPIICRHNPLRESKNLATAWGFASRKRCAIK